MNNSISPEKLITSSPHLLPQMLAEDEEPADNDISSESSYTSSEDDEERRQLLRTDFDFESFSP